MTLEAQRAGLLIATGEQPSPVPLLICASLDAPRDALLDALRCCGLGVADCGSTTCSGSARESPDAAQSREDLTRRLVEFLRGDNGEVARAAVVEWRDFASLVVMPDSPRPANGGHRQQRRPQWRTTLDGSLPGLRFLHLVRRDKNAEFEGDSRERDASNRLAELRADDWNWIGFFTWARAEPLTVAYEDVIADPAGTLQRVLAFLELEQLTEGVADSIELATLPIHFPRGRPDSDLSGSAASSLRRSGAASKPPSVSIIVVSHNEGEKLPLTVNGIRATVPDDVEIVVVDDWSTDGSIDSLDPSAVRVVRTAVRGGVTGARNAGAAQAQGDLLIFADAHVDPAPGWLEALRDALADRSVGCAGPTITQIHQRRASGHGFTWREPQLRMAWLRSADPSTHEVPFVCGCLMAFRRSDFEAVGGFDSGMIRWGSEDAEICLHLWRRGKASVVVPAAQVAHLFRPVAPYEVPPHLVVHNSLRMATAHLPPTAVRLVIAAFKDLPTFPVAYAQLVDSDVWERRDSVGEKAIHDGAWFLDYFRIGALR